MTASVSSKDAEAVAAIARVLDRGGLVVIPTDTVYGIAASIMHPSAIARIFEAKSRSLDKAMTLLVGSLEEAMRYGRFSDDALAAAREGWPGALTLVVARGPDADRLELGGDGSTIGLRVPDHSLVLSLIASAGPLAATSANLSGGPVMRSIEEIEEALGDRIDLYVDDGELNGRPSRVVTFVGRTGGILRE